MNQNNVVALAALALAGWLGAGPLTAPAAPGPAGSPTNSAPEANETRAAGQAWDDADPAWAQHERPWLGVAIEEASEALSEQLGLEPGVGLVIVHVVPGSPADRAGLKKNDVLVEWAGHRLVHPGQLRRLVQARRAGDVVKLVFYRGGARQTASVTLAHAPPSFSAWMDRDALREPFRELQRELRDLRLGDVFRDYGRQFREQLGRFSTEQVPKVQKEIQRSLQQARQALQDAARRMSNAQPRIQMEIERSIEQARQALEQALRQMTNVQHSLPAAPGPLRDLLRSGIRLDKNASVVVRTRGETARTLVKSDDWGTLVLIGPPHLHLTAHDKEGKLLFDGAIETPEQRAKVPPEVWQRVAPLLDEPEDRPGPAGPPQPPSRPGTVAPAGTV